MTTTNIMFHFIRSAYFNKLRYNLSQGDIQISINNDNINKIYFILNFYISSSKYFSNKTPFLS